MYLFDKYSFSGMRKPSGDEKSNLPFSFFDPDITKFPGIFQFYLGVYGL